MKLYIIFILLSLSLFAQESIEENVEKEPIATEEQESIQIVKTSDERVEEKTKLDKTQKVSEPTIATLISQIKEAKSDNRRVLMNQLKVKLREMNKESRQKTMRELKKSFSKESCKAGQQKHKHQKNRAIRHQQLRHQPRFRQIHNGQGRGNR